MLQRVIEDLKTSSGTGFRLGALAVACGVCVFVTTAFLCAALFVVVWQRYGLVEACLSGAAVYVVVTLLVTGCYFLYKRELRQRAAEAEKSALTSMLADPAMIGVALQIGRSIGFKRLVPLLAIAGVALGLSTARRQDGADSTD